MIETNRHVDLISWKIDLVMRVRTVMQDEGDLVIRIIRYSFGMDAAGRVGWLVRISSPFVGSTKP